MGIVNMLLSKSAIRTMKALSQQKGTAMKDGIHPKVYKAKITCACGNEIAAESTKGAQVQVEICSNCHPYYTGKQRFVDTAGRIDRFRKKYATTQK